MTKIGLSGIDHLAVATSNMKSTLEFYTGTLGLPLGGLFWMHGVQGAVHAFLPFEDGRTLSFIQFAEDPPAQLGVSHAATMRDGVPGGVMQHVALQVPDHAALDEMRARIKEHGVGVSQPIDHGFCTSIYFDGPDGVHLEITCQLRPLDDREFDATAAAHCGIDADDLNALRNPSRSPSSRNSNSRNSNSEVSR